MLSVLKHGSEHSCTACWSGHYKIPIDQPLSVGIPEASQLLMF
jgi:hypothetical protein